MPIISIIEQPAINDLKAAYRPVVLRVTATRADDNAIPPIVYCDIYVDDVYYKTISKTQYTSLNLTNSEWKFDIQDACQEKFRAFLAPNGGSSIVQVASVMSLVYCKFRSSGYDVDGFQTPDGIPPVQGTGTIDPVAGTGTQSNSFVVINATLQHEQNQNLIDHLNSYKQGTWDANAYPLTHRGKIPGDRNYKVCKGDSDYFPVYSGSAGLSCIILHYTLKDGTTGSVSNCDLFPSCPVVTNINIDAVDNGDSTQTFTFTWDAPDPLLTSIVIQYRTDGSSDAFTDVSGSTVSGRTLTLPLGLYEFKFQMRGACNTSTSSTFTGQGIDAPACVPVAISGTPSLPVGTSGVAYSYSFSVTGSLPVSVSGYSGPAWLTPTPSGGNINFSGTPAVSDEGTGISVSFTITNACGSIPFSDTIDILSAPRTLNFSIDQFGGNAAMRIALNHPVDVDINIDFSNAVGYPTSDCSGGSQIASEAASGLVIPAGQYSVVNPFPSSGWASVGSFSILSASISISGGFSGPVFPGDVITIGSYSVTIIFYGC